jgi:iron complex transport system substrate-binding protein
VYRSVRALAVAAMLAWPALPVAAAAGTPPRIVSLVPSLTEDLFAIGAGPQVVATSEFSDYPAAAARLPQISSSSSVDAERIIELHPDVIVGITAQSALVSDLRRLGMHVVLMDDDSYDDIFRDLAILGRVSGRSAQAAALARRLQDRTVRILRGFHAAGKPRVFVVLGVAPIFTVGPASYIARLIEMAGGRNAASDLGSAYGRYSAEVLLAKQPDVLVADVQSGLSQALDRAPWSALRAVREHRVYVLPDAGILERPGPRYNDGLAWLVARLHPHGT